MKKIFRKELLIGVIVIAALTGLFIGIDFLKGINIFKAANYYTAVYTNVEGLAISAPVSLNGFKVGQVREINYEYDNPGHVRVEIALDKNLKLPKGTEAIIKTDMLGTATIELNMAHNKEFYNVGDQLEGVVDPGLMNNLTNSMLPTVNNILPKIDSLLLNINAIVASPELTASVKRLDALTANLELTSKHLSELSKALPVIAGNAKTITSNFSQSSDDLVVLTSKMREIPVDSLADNVTAITTNLRQLSDQLNAPNSTIGKLANDPSLYNNINATVSSLDSLLIDIKKNPKRYISIKLL